jgi:hypothetical protein
MMEIPMEPVQNAAMKKPWVPMWLWRWVSTPCAAKVPSIFGALALLGASAGAAFYMRRKAEELNAAATTNTFPESAGVTH